MLMTNTKEISLLVTVKKFVEWKNTDDSYWYINNFIGTIKQETSKNKSINKQACFPS